MDCFAFGSVSSSRAVLSSPCQQKVQASHKAPLTGQTVSLFSKQNIVYVDENSCLGYNKKALYSSFGSFNSFFIYLVCIFDMVYSAVYFVRHLDYLADRLMHTFFLCFQNSLK